MFHLGQGRRHEVLLGGGGGIHGHPNPPTPKTHFLLGFRPLYFGNVGLLKKCIRVKKKVTEISSFLWGRPPLISRLRGTRPPLLVPMTRAAGDGRR